MLRALEEQSFLIQRLVGLLPAKSPVITGSQPKGERGCGPLSLLLIYSSFMIRDQSRQAEKPRDGGEGGGGGGGGGGGSGWDEERRGQGEREK